MVVLVEEYLKFFIEISDQLKVTIFRISLRRDIVGNCIADDLEMVVHIRGYYFIWKLSMGDNRRMPIECEALLDLFK